MKKIIALIAICIITMMPTVSANAAAQVTALMYHSITNDETRWDDYTVSPQQLDNDIQYFKACGYIPITATELAEEDFANIDGKRILLLTFDDGYSNFYTQVFPILKKHNAKATMYLIGSYINRYGYLTEEQTYEMANSGLVEIGNHTDSIHHTPVEQLKRIYNDPYAFNDVINDVKNNGEILKKITGKKITSISWPYGCYNPDIDRAIKKQLGYKISFSTAYEVNLFDGDTTKPLNRMNREYSASTQEVFDRANAKFYNLTRK